MNRLAYLLVLLTLLLTARVAWAGNVEAKDRAARTACLSGDYAKGVSLLIELFVDTKDPTYIYNQGRCYEQNRRYEDAISRFQEYLRAGKRLGKNEKADAQKHIADCKELLASQPSQPPVVVTAPQPVPAPAPLPAPSPVASAPVPPVVKQTNTQPASESGSGLRTTGIITAAVGGAALVAGLILNLKVNSMADDLQKTDSYTPGKESDRKTYENLGWASYGVGTACVATGAVLYVLGLRFGAPVSTYVTLVPTFTPGQAGAVVKGAF
jgi:hypothetical protein